MTKITLESVAKDMQQWRATRLKRGPIPETLKKKIGKLPSRYSISEITKALNINTRHLTPQGKAHAKQSSPPKANFIRITSPTLLTEGNKIICSFKRPDGMTLDCSIEQRQFSQLLEEFLCSR